MTVQRKGGRPRKGEAVIDRDKIVQMAWAIVDEHGLAGLSTRTLAAALEVKSPAIYWHVGSKEALFSLMMEDLLQDSISDCDGPDWQDWFIKVGQRQRELLLSHRDASVIASIAPPTERIRSDLFPRLFQPLVDGGMDLAMASAAAGGLASLVLGWVIYEQRPATHSMMEVYHDPDVAFDSALAAFVSGLAKRLG